MGSWALMAKFRMLRGVFGGLVLLSVVWASQEAVHSLSDDTESKPTLSTDHISSPVEFGKELGESGARMSKNSEMDFKHHKEIAAKRKGVKGKGASGESDFKTQMENHHKAAKATLEKHMKERESFKQAVENTKKQHSAGEGAHKTMVKTAQVRAARDGWTKHAPANAPTSIHGLSRLLCAKS